MLEEEKRALRQAVRAQIAALPPDCLRQAGRQIALRLAACPEYRRARTVLAFASTEREVDLFPFLRRVLRDGKRLALPRCTAPGQMEARELRSLEALRPGRFGILEPGADSLRLEPGDIQFAVVPCLACDRGGGRLGHGGGFYDRYLSRYRGPAALVCPEQLLRPSIPMGPLDQAIPLVVTEERVYRNGAAEAETLQTLSEN